MNKDKISIALTKNLLKQINNECEKTGLSRSSAIEMILRQHYNNKSDKSAISEPIICGN